ncbi:MAG: PSD1 domain-containing protein, partial [Verrucomicrobia bacterium]|nr:PSD1 domain-containing protein [Verrucomicrobiota bacterium]
MSAAQVSETCFNFWGRIAFGCRPCQQARSLARVLGAILEVALVSGWLLAVSISSAKAAPLRMDFNRDVRPILSDHCSACHGPDEKARKSGLRLDTNEAVFSPAKSGAIPVVPGDLKKSELIQRILSSDADDRMPPAKGGKPLSDQQIETLKQWVAEGAEWKQHWAYVKPSRPEPPAVNNKAWPRNDIDRFILHRLEREGLEPAPEAPRERLIRRATLDLTGLPPTVEEIDAFLAENSPEAYEKLVDRLLQSKAYGERQAMFWLDLARYGETQGYHHDNHRDMWHWRDWVIKALNNNMPFDQFTIEQLAGDLLPDPTTDQLIATGFHRNEMTTSEGGALPEEYAVKYGVGRVDTTARVWMGTSLACAECHDHKYDPITQKEYYQFFAFFNTIPENGLDQQLNPVPRIELKTPEHNQRLAQFDAEIAALELARKKILEETNATYAASQQQWEDSHRTKNIDNWGPLLPMEMASQNGAVLTASADNSIGVTGKNPDRDIDTLRLLTPAKELSGLRLEAIPDPALPHGKAGRSENGEFILTRIEATARSPHPEKTKADFQRIQFGPWSRLGPFVGSSSKEAFGKDFGPEGKVDLQAAYQDGKLKWQEVPSLKDGEVHALAVANASFYFYRTIRAAEARRIELRLGSGGGLRVWLNGRSVHSNDADRAAAPDQDKVQIRLSRGENKLLVKVVNRADQGGFYFRAEPVLEHKVSIAAGAADTSRGGYPVNGALDELIETGWSIDAANETARQPHYAWFRLSEPIGFAEGTELEVRLIFDAPVPKKTLARFRLAVTASDDLAGFLALPDNTRALLLVEPRNRTPAQRLEIQGYYREQFVPEAKNLVKVLNDKRSEQQKYRDTIPVAMVMQEMEKPRDTHFLIRGEYHHRGEKVSPGAPQAILPWLDGLPKNRLGLAKWLLHPDHPLTSRVVVNHFWQQHFGTGLVKTSEDFGVQGERPSHPELLDWLATEFRRSRWDMKHLHRLIVTSATYRQDATTSPRHADKDPMNRWLSRFPRQRLEAEAVRDVALAVSGLLNPQIGGSSVFPYQPPGLWEQVAFEGTRTWEQNRSKGEDNYRRGLYVYWRRSIPYASFVTFDAPTRETCTVRRPRTNTPLQALALLNDPVYVEAARALGQRIMQKGGGS